MATFSISHHPTPSFSPFLYIFSPYICRLPLGLFIHSSPGNGGCQSRPSTSPVLQPTAHLFLSPLTHPSLSPIHHCHFFSFLFSFFFLSIPFIPASLGLFRKMHLRSIFLQSLLLFILVPLLPPLDSFFDLSFPLKQTNGKKSWNANLYTLFLSAALSWRSSRVDPTLSDTDAPWVTVSWPAFLILYFGLCVRARACVCCYHKDTPLARPLLESSSEKLSLSLPLSLSADAVPCVVGGLLPSCR